MDFQVLTVRFVVFVHFYLAARTFFFPFRLISKHASAARMLIRERDIVTWER